ncbi:DUF6940 family protein [Bernardetia sp.]|uniref:DUF6940 family protein n=1 Tax=Bernardetia sp. TaxID=1937974 RepID=UPI0025BC4C52|nr:hypothetical protein [Bernardetia sp.]
MNYKVEMVEQSEQIKRFYLLKNESYLTFNEVFELWQADDNFITFYINTLINFDYKAFHWEHPCLEEPFLDKKYECTITKSKRLEAASVNEEAFKEHIYTNECVIDFMNLGKNARLIIPSKKTDKEVYNHLGKFIRAAPKEQIMEVFKRTGKLVTKEIKENGKIWLNTAGLGVIWLHIRLDTKPKYYKTRKYKDPNFLNTIE